MTYPAAPLQSLATIRTTAARLDGETVNAAFCVLLAFLTVLKVLTFCHRPPRWWRGITAPASRCADSFS